MKRSAHVGVALTLLAAFALSIEMQAAKRIRGGETYKSKTKFFEVVVPRGCSPFLAPYEVQEGNRKGDEFFEEAVFYMKDMGEVYHAGVRRLTPELRGKVSQEEGRLSAPQLAWLGVFLHFGPREKSTGAWQPASGLEEVQTKHGPGVLSANSVEGGRFLTTMTIEDGKMVQQASAPASVVVLMVQKAEYLIYVTGQADGAAMLGTSSDAGCVQGRLREMIDSLTIVRPLPPAS